MLGTLNVGNTGGWQKWELVKPSVNNVTGVHDVFFVFKGDDSNYLFNIDYWQFVEGEGQNDDGNDDGDDDEEEESEKMHFPE